jgi:hypothetical protein
MLYVEVSDDTDPPGDLVVTVQHSPNGTTSWSSYLLGTRVFNEGLWQVDVTPDVDANVGNYDFRASVRDTGGNKSADMVLPNALEVLNNIPTAPEVRILPQHSVTTSQLTVEILQSASDIESSGLTYHYLWYCNGELKDHITGDSVPSSETAKGQNWSVEVRAFDGMDEGPSGSAWMMIQNAPPLIKIPLPDPEIEEDTTDSDWLLLANAFEDVDGDLLTYSCDPAPSNVTVEIDATTGVVTLTPAENWSGVESITFVATDGEYQVSQTVTMTVLPVNDPPLIATVIATINDQLVPIISQPVTGEPISFHIMQGESLAIIYVVVDVEGDEVQASVNSTAVSLDEELGTILFKPDNDAVGTLRFALSVWDVVSPSEKVVINFNIEVENENDPMDDPVITDPSSGTEITKDFASHFTAVCTDPDVQFGQVLEFTWSSNITGILGTGETIVVWFDETGAHQIQLTVTDGEFEKTTSIQVIVVVLDRDGDGIADDDDDFPQDMAASVDSDGDGYPDAWNTGMTESDSITGLTIDYYPDDPDRWEKEKKKDDSPSPGAVGAIVAIGIIAVVIRRTKRR